MDYKKLSLNSKRVLLIFGNSRAGLSIARSISEIGAEVHNVRSTKNKTEIDYSNSISKSIYLGDIFSDFNGVFSGLSEILDNFDIVIPVNDAAYELSFKLKHLATKSQFKHLPEEKNYRLVSDKFLIHKEFYDLFALSKISLNDLYIKNDKKIWTDSDFPIYSKPRVSTSVIGRCVRSFGVKRIKNNVDLIRHVRDSWPVQCLYQPVIKNGQSVGINVVALNGKILGIACTRRLHQPKDGGGSSYRISEKVSDKYNNIALEIVNRVQWTGFMMIECIVKDNDLFLIEINPRPYGSLPLTIYSGVDMPKLLYGDAHSTTKIVVAKPDYRARNFAKDLKWLMRNPMSFLNWLSSFRHFFLGKERFDIERLSDILPAFAQLQRPFNNLGNRLKNKFLFINSDDNFDPTKPVIFVCKGNINRSIVSERLLAKNSNIAVDSCGFISKPGRKISQNAEDFLTSHGIDGTTHQSKFIKDDLINSTQVVVFERAHIRHVKKSFSNKKVFLLSRIAKNKAFDIKDPEFETPKEAYKIFEEINDCLKAIYG
tara:strand:- start:1020 stop:2642 length:1623 start_codon:yes stop_codon:yes gene_type:complete